MIRFRSGSKALIHCGKPCASITEAKVDEVMLKAIQAGATEISPAKDHEYGYRQGMFKDPFGHYWQIQKKIF